jgi:regulator of protease activity HflC (stomatin/prohibitin superfamily)
VSAVLDDFDDDEGDLTTPKVTGSRFGVYSAVIFLVVVFLGVLFYDRSLHSVRAGQLGIRWSRFTGTRLDEVYKEGLRIIPPWDQLYIYNVRQQEMHDSITVLSSNGLPIWIKYSARYQPDVKQLAKLHQQFGPNYAEILIRPEIVSGLRQVIGNYKPEEIYSRDEEGLNTEVLQSINRELRPYPVKVDKVLSKELRLTLELEDAINDKLVAEQSALSYEYRIRSESDEARRREIEARGIRNFELLSGISILRWRGIQATEKLATSTNAKVIIMGGNGKDLPFLLNGTP